jgi:hypothetical protein
MIIWSKVFIIVLVNRWPFVVIELVAEDFAVEERAQVYALVHQLLEVV